MKDEFHFSAPLGFLGHLAEGLFLTRYMTRFLVRRAAELKTMAESDGWQRFLPGVGIDGLAGPGGVLNPGGS